MRLVVIGVNHKTARVALRERLALVGDDVNIALQQLERFTDGSVIVSTCNRTEIYALVPQVSVPSESGAALAAQQTAVSSNNAISTQPSTAAISAHILKIKAW